MRVRTFLILALVLSILFAILVFWDANQDLLGQHFTLLGGATVGVGWTLFWAFVLGVTITAFVGLAREFGLIFESVTTCLGRGWNGGLRTEPKPQPSR